MWRPLSSNRVRKHLKNLKQGKDTEDRVQFHTSVDELTDSFHLSSLIIIVECHLQTGKCTELVLVLLPTGRIYRINIDGPSREPCGTPWLTLSYVDDSLFMWAERIPDNWSSLIPHLNKQEANSDESTWGTVTQAPNMGLEPMTLRLRVSVELGHYHSAASTDVPWLARPTWSSWFSIQGQSKESDLVPVFLCPCVLEWSIKQHSRQHSVMMSESQSSLLVSTS